MEEKNMENDAQSVGEILRNARLKQAKTLSDASKELCIRKSYLEAIENMELEKIPPMPYGIGFIRSYSEYLGLNSKRIVSSYRKTILNDEEYEQEDNSVNQAAGPKFFHILIAIFCLVVIFIAWSYSDEIREAGLAKKVVQPQPAETEEIIIQDAVIPEPVILDEHIEKQAPEGSIPEDDTLSENSEETESAEIETSLPQEQNQESRIKFVLTGPSWIELKQGDNVLLSGIYHTGFEYEIPSGKDMVISVGRYYNAKFYVDGKPRKVVSSMKHTNINLDEILNQN